ncbi:MAG TPA: hypothetical protein VGB53_11730 [Rubricoccaceae bacterium]|jgi:hypothetical protein
MPLDSLLTSAGAVTPEALSVLEAVDHLSSIVVVLVSLAALYQLKLTKDAVKASQGSLKTAADALAVAKSDIEIRSRREAVTLAATLCGTFADKLPHLNKSISNITNAGVQIRRWDLNNYNFDSSSILDKTKEADWVSSIPHDGEDMHDVMNWLESYAIYFDKGAADEQVAYKATGAIFTDFVSKLAPFVIHMRAGTGTYISGPFQSTVNIFRLWTEREEAEALESDIAAKNQKLTRLNPAPRMPLGTTGPPKAQS